MHIEIPEQLQADHDEIRAAYAAYYDKRYPGQQPPDTMVVCYISPEDAEKLSVPQVEKAGLYRYLRVTLNQIRAVEIMKLARIAPRVPFGAGWYMRFFTMFIWLGADKAEAVQFFATQEGQQ